MSYGEILAIDGLLSADECKETMDIMDSLIKTGYAVEVNKHSGRNDECVHLHITSLNGFDVAIALCQRFQNAVLPEYISRFPILNYKSLGLLECKAQRTEAGGGFHDWHYEASDGSTTDRVLTWTVYLNDDFEGGETEFLYQNKRIRPKAGTGCVFPTGFLHTHRGNPPIGGTKYILTGWVVDLDPYARQRA